MDDIKTILANKKIIEPDEIKIIKDFIYKHFDSPSNILVQPRQIIIIVSSAGLAGSLRFMLTDLKKVCKTDKRFLIRIGQVD
ncbi:MAG TPA: hypothetical protein VMR34_04425 [Candidatus Saccharimonadales bacterium]|nr:hypothetical protein [Candidatus Saccharimonadales bacterium]